MDSIDFYFTNVSGTLVRIIGEPVSSETLFKMRKTYCNKITAYFNSILTDSMHFSWLCRHLPPNPLSLLLLLFKFKLFKSNERLANIFLAIILFPFVGKISFNVENVNKYQEKILLIIEQYVKQIVKTTSKHGMKSKQNK